MSESNQEPASADADEALRKRLLNRIGIAGVAVVVLLGGLAVLDAINREPPPAVPPVAKAPPPEPAPAATPPSQAPAEPATAEGSAPAAEATAGAAPPAQAEPVAAPEGTSAVSGRPLKPLTPPATARPAMVKPSEPLAPAKPEPGRALARTAPAGAGPLSRPLSQAVQSSRQFILQMGVFNNLANAEELRAKLELNGIPAQIEARVQVGPFATREEADAAREKLRTLGMDSGILTAISTRK